MGENTNPLTATERLLITLALFNYHQECVEEDEREEAEREKNRLLERKRYNY